MHHAMRYAGYSIVYEETEKGWYVFYSTKVDKIPRDSMKREDERTMNISIMDKSIVISQHSKSSSLHEP